MNRGPLPGRAKTDFVAIATDAWSPPPDWILALAEEATRSTQGAVAARIGYSTGVVSNVLRNKYPGVLAGVEDAVRTALMGAVVDCPVLGEIERRRCLDEQAKPFRATNRMTIRLFHACRGACPHALKNREAADAV